MPESDDELALKAQSDDENALEELVRRYKSFIRRKARTFHAVGIDHDDLVQEGIIGLYRAIRDFDPSKSAFSTFVQLCITRQMITAVNTARRQKNLPLNTSISLDSYVAGDEGGGRQRRVADTLVGDEDLVLREGLERPEVQEVIHQISDGLPFSSFEMRVVMYYLRGMTYEEIASRLGRSTKSVDNALQRAKRKFEQYLGSRVGGVKVLDREV